MIEGTTAKIREKMIIRRLKNQCYGIHCSIFSTFEVNLSRTKVPMPRYGQKRSFAVFETGFIGLAVLFLALWWLLLVD